MLGPCLFLGFAVFAHVAAQGSCPGGRPCVQANVCTRQMNAAGQFVNLTALPQCGFTGSRPLVCCPAETNVPLGALPSTTQRPYVTASNNQPPSSATSARPTTAYPRPQSATTTRMPTTSSQTTTSRRPAPVTGSHVGAHALLSPAPNNKSPAIYLRENVTDVRISDREQPVVSFGSTSNLPPSSSLYPGSNLVNSAHSGPINFPQKNVVQSITQPIITQPKDLMRHPNIKLLPVDRCGRNADESTERIHGTVETASLGEYPWVAQLGELRPGKNFRMMCGGSVINKRYILTAGQCIRQELTYARLGEYDIDTDPDCAGQDDCAEPTQIIKISEKIRHERYDKPYSQNDIGLVRLERSLPHHFSSYIRPICIPLKQEVDVVNNYSRIKLRTIGWGLTHSVSKPHSPILLEAELNLVTNRDCGSLQVKPLHSKIADTQICANSTYQSSTACQGDTGGPLMLLTLGYGALTEIPVYMQLGIVSHGPDECGLNAPPAIATRVSSFAEWILDNIRD
ncbi:melanization protease 1-like [Cloeon dipterum]|uniref:melanization protease 1-like n=1 Tax=Cloeon dipterum TaxID=197152 RepID=UPI00321F774E